MPETTISPGVFISETDQSQTPIQQTNIGLAVVGPTSKGAAFVPTVVKSAADFQTKFGGSTLYNKTVTYVPQTVNSFAQQGGISLVTRVLGGGGFAFNSSRKLAALVTSGSNIVLSVLYPSLNTDTLDLSGSTWNGSANSAAASVSITGSFVLGLSGSNFAATTMSASLNPNAANYVLNILGSAPNNVSGSSQDNAFTYINFRSFQSASTTSRIYLVTSSATIEFTGSTSEGYDHGRTPWITSGNSNKQLFKFHHLSDGFDTNTDVYTSITDLVEPADVQGVPQYSTFTILVRRVGDSDIQPTVLESFNGCNLDPKSPDFISKKIGDKYSEYNSSFGKVITNGDFANISQFVRVEVSEEVKNGALSPKLSPRGHEAYYDVTGFAPTFAAPSASLQKNKIYNGFYQPLVFLGFDNTNQDNYNYLKPVPKVGGSYQNGGNAAFNIDVLTAHPSASWTGSLSASADIAGTSGPTGKQLQFNVAMQFGNDGMDYQTWRYVGSNISSTNVFGMNLSSTTTAGGLAYAKAINILANKDLYNFNILAVPGVIDEFHGAVTNTVLNMIEERGDSIYIMDLSDIDATVASAANETSDLDSSYAAVYYPWVQMKNTSNGTPEYFPPSVVMPAVYQRNDTIAAPWFAPAGLNRGGLPGVIQVKNPLNQNERDILYQSRVNPIATYPNEGIVAWGQKTLQRAKSATDRINVRRLMINLRKFVNSRSRYLVFDNNTISTRKRFLDTVNPYLKNVQEREGLYAYKVVMDSTNNTNDVIDRNEMVGAIIIQPTKTAEFIKIGFVLTPTGVQI